MVMTISNYSGTANTFTFPNNPMSFDDAIVANYTTTNVGYQRHHYFISGGGIAPKKIVLQGSFFGSSKNTNYSTLAGHFIENTKLKKLYWDSDKFYLGFGKEIKKTHSGGRTNFLDYVATFETLVGVLFSNTQKTSGTNEGNVTTFIEEITGQHDGAGDVVISDALGNQITIPEASFTGKTYFKLKFVDMIDSGDGIYVTEYNYFEVCATVDGVYTQVKTVRTTDGFGILQLAPGANISTITITNTTGTPVKKFRDAYA